ncbi:MAG: hypothetical protein AAB467_04030 [Patescibacteria group bacterium]|mgnify:CR=1 FL=1
MLEVYLKDADKQKHFSTMDMEAGNPVQRWQVYQLDGTPLFRKGNRYYLTLQNLTDEIPENFEKLVSRISYTEIIPAHPMRENGVYRFRTAKAIVTLGSTEKLYREVTMVSTDLPDLLELYNLIRAGNIRPEVSYGGKHGGKPRHELMEELAQALMFIGVLEKRLVDAESERLTAEENTSDGSNTPNGVVTRETVAIKRSEKEIKLEDEVANLRRESERMKDKLFAITRDEAVLLHRLQNVQYIVDDLRSAFFPFSENRRLANKLSDFLTMEYK